MKCFFDTSALIKNYIEEAGSSRVADVAQEAEAIFVSELSLVECFSTLKRILLEKLITEEDYEHLKDEIHRDFGFFSRVGVDAALKHCKRLMDIYQLKTLDSLQLASALCVRREMDYFVCCDRKLLSAAGREALETEDPTQA